MICSNIGRKGDKIVRKEERLRRRWLWKRFKVRLVFPKNKNRCHALRRHGPQYNIMKQFERTQGQSGPRVPQYPFASRFYSHDLMWEAREAFLLKYESEMKKIAAAVDAGKKKQGRMPGHVSMNVPIGEGLVRPAEQKTYPWSRETEKYGVKHFSNIREAFFAFRYINGQWYEITGYPDVKRKFESYTQSGPVIEL